IKTITIFTSPTASVNAGFDQTICGDATEVNLSGFIAIASGGVWSTPDGTGAFTPNNTSLNAKYIPTAADTDSGTITLTLTSVGNGFCTPVSDDMILTITNTPTAVPGGPYQICADAAGANITGMVFDATGGMWSTSGSGTFAPDAATLNATYVPSAT